MLLCGRRDHRRRRQVRPPRPRRHPRPHQRARPHRVGGLRDGHARGGGGGVTTSSTCPSTACLPPPPRGPARKGEGPEEKARVDVALRRPRALPPPATAPWKSSSTRACSFALPRRERRGRVLARPRGRAPRRNGRARAHQCALFVHAELPAPLAEGEKAARFGLDRAATRRTSRRGRARRRTPPSTSCSASRKRPALAPTSCTLLVRCGHDVPESEGPEDAAHGRDLPALPDVRRRGHPDGATEFKCAAHPRAQQPRRSSGTRSARASSIRSSPTTLLRRWSSRSGSGDFMKAWGGISSFAARSRRDLDGRRRRAAGAFATSSSG